MIAALRDGSTLQTRVFAGSSAIGWIMMFVTSGYYVSGLFGLLYHLSLAPVVANLKAPTWARMAGFVWIFSDAVLDVCRINGLSEETIWAFRLGIHISSAMWIVFSSLNLPRRMAIPGVLLGASLAIHAVIAPFLDNSELVLGVTAIPLMVIWLGTIAFSYQSEAEAQVKAA